MCESYEVDPDGDLLIILAASKEAFALWNDSDDLEALPELLESNCRDEITGSSSTTGERSPQASYASPSPLHLKISSKHLIMASRRFKKMLTGDWAEATMRKYCTRNLKIADTITHLTYRAIQFVAIRISRSKASSSPTPFTAPCRFLFRLGLRMFKDGLFRTLACSKSISIILPRCSS